MNNPQNSQRELIDYIREKLWEYEEPYKLGAWENFNRKQKKRALPVFRYSAAAIIAAVGLYVLLPANDSIEPARRQLKHIAAKQSSHLPYIKAESENKAGFAGQYTKVKGKASFHLQAINETFLAEAPLTTNIEKTETPDNQLIFSLSKDTLIDNSIVSDNEDKLQVSSKKFWEEDGQVASITPENSKKWGFDLQVSSSLFKKGSMSAGFQVGYELSNKVVLSSGILVGILTATEEFDKLPATNKHLQSTDATLTGVEIPLEIRYSISPTFYTSVGITSFAVLSDSRTNNYIEQKTITENIELVSGQFVTRTSVIEEEFSEKAPRSAFNDTDHAGFYSLSVGYKSRISKKNTFSIEPFLKIPVQNVTDSDLKLGNGGLRVKIGF